VEKFGRPFWRSLTEKDRFGLLKCLKKHCPNACATKHYKFIALTCFTQLFWGIHPNVIEKLLGCYPEASSFTVPSFSWSKNMQISKKAASSDHILLTAQMEIR